MNKQIEVTAGMLQRKATMLNKKKKGQTKIDAEVNRQMAEMQEACANMIREKLRIVNSPEFLENK